VVQGGSGYPPLLFVLQPRTWGIISGTRLSCGRTTVQPPHPRPRKTTYRGLRRCVIDRRVRRHERGGRRALNQGRGDELRRLGLSQPSFVTTVWSESCAATRATQFARGNVMAKIQSSRFRRLSTSIKQPPPPSTLHTVRAWCSLHRRAHWSLKQGPLTQPSSYYWGRYKLDDLARIHRALSRCSYYTK